MKPEFRPIPITILDLLGVLLPGFVWLLLLVSTGNYLVAGTSSPVELWKDFLEAVKAGGKWQGPLAATLAALLVGYGLKPLSMRVAQLLSRYLFKLQPGTRSLPSRGMVFPFEPVFDEKPYMERIRRALSAVTRVAPEDMPGKVPFSAAKRYLKLVSPSLWEESERMEAEVRMTGALFLAAVYHLGLASAVLIAAAIRQDQGWSLAEWSWLVGAVLATVILGFGFNQLRVHEVEYTYLNLLLATGNRDFGEPVEGAEAVVEEDS